MACGFFLASRLPFRLGLQSLFRIELFRSRVNACEVVG